MSRVRRLLLCGTSLRVDRTVEWTCPACRTVNEEVGDVRRVRVRCGHCGRETVIDDGDGRR